MVFSFTTLHSLHSQSVFRTSDRELYEYRSIKYEDSLNLSKSLDGVVWPDASFKKVSKKVVKSTYGSDYSKNFIKMDIEAVDFFYKKRLGMIGDCTCEGFQTLHIYIGVYKKPTQRVIFIEPTNTPVYSPTPPPKSITRVTRKYIVMTPKFPNVIPYPVFDHNPPPPNEHLTTNHILRKESFTSFNAKGYPTYDPDQKCWATIDDGYSDKQIPKNNNE